jgi:N-acetylmuramoyl-L-alanine amidase
MRAPCNIGITFCKRYSHTSKLLTSIRQRNLYVLHHHELPAVWIDGGYLTARIKACSIKSWSYRRVLSEAIARAILSYKQS